MRYIHLQISPANNDVASFYTDPASGTAWARSKNTRSPELYCLGSAHRPRRILGKKCPRAHLHSPGRGNEPPSSGTWAPPLAILPPLPDQASAPVLGHPVASDPAFSPSSWWEGHVSFPRPPWAPHEGANSARFTENKINRSKFRAPSQI